MGAIVEDRYNVIDLLACGCAVGFVASEDYLFAMAACVLGAILSGVAKGIYKSKKKGAENVGN